ncbi:MAG: alpha/beta hydrolase [Ilumatobacteraceae bacterium]
MRRALLAGLSVAAVAASATVAAYERRILAGLDATPDPATDGGLRFPAEAEHSIPTPDGGSLHVEECGAGQPIVLLHGHGANLGIFAPLAVHLRDGGRRVIAIDQRGFGRSSAVPPTFGFQGLVDDIAEVIVALDLHDAVVVGHSLGGAVALGLAIDHQVIVAQRVAAVVLVNSAARGPADGRIIRAKAAALEWSLTERVGRHPRHGLVLARANFGAEPRRSHVVGVREVGFGSPAAPRRGLTGRLLGTDLTARLGTIRVPVVVLAGGLDRVLSVHESERVVERVRTATLEVFPGAGHVLPVERSAEVAARILALGRSGRSGRQR